MEDKLKHLNEKMNSTLLKNLDFSQRRKQAVLKSIKTVRNKNALPKSSFWKPILSAVVTGALCVGIGFFTFEHVKAPTEGKVAQLKLKDKKTENAPPVKEEYYGDMTKEEILTKMLNTIDYFDTAKGSFEEYTHDTKRTVKYELDMGKDKGGWSKLVNSYQNNLNTRIDYYDQKYVWVIDEETQSYREAGYFHPSKCCTLTLKQAFTKDSSGVDMTMSRERPPIGPSQNSLFPYEIASNYTRDLGKWNIEKQNEKLIGHNTAVLSGELNPYASEKSQAKTFRFWVDKDTGILVKYETYNAMGEVVHYLHPKELIINESVDPEKHKPDFKKYKKR